MNYITVIVFCVLLLRLGQANPVIRTPHHQLNVPYQIPHKFSPQTDLRLDDVGQLTEEQIQKAIHDVRITINEVQKRLAADPNMPRLTKGEIEELFENVTREELVRSIHMGDQRREKHMRALMLVLPYHTKEMTPEKIQELYTKQPQTQLRNLQTSIESSNIPAFRPLVTKSTTTTTTTTETPVTAVPSMQRYPPLPLEPFGLRDQIIPLKGQPGPFTPPTNPPLIQKQQKFRKKVPSQLLTIAQRGKVDVASISITQAPLFTTTTKKPTRNPQSVFDILQAIGLHQEKVKESYMATSTTTSTTTTTPAPPSTTTEMSEEMKKLLMDFGLYKQEKPVEVHPVYQPDVPYVPDVQYEPKYSFSVQNPGFSVGSDDFRPLPMMENPYQGPVFNGFSSFDTELGGSEKVSVTVKAPESISEATTGTSSTSTSTTTSTTTTTTTTTTPKPSITKPKLNKPTDFVNFRPIKVDNAQAISEDFQSILRQFGLLGGESTPTKTRAPKKQKTSSTTTSTTTPSTTTTTTTTTEMPFKYLPEVISIPLPSDMMAVLQNLGVSTESPIAIKVQMPSSSKPTRSRAKLSVVTPEKVESVTPEVTESNAEVLKTTSSQAAAFSRRSETKTTPVSSTTERHSSMKPIVVAEIPMEKPVKIESHSRTNIFKPTIAAKHTTADDYKKLEHLLETIKELDKLNTTLTSKHLDQLDLNNFNFSDSLVHQGPDPVNFYPQNSHPLKNEIKRQESTDNPTKISLDLNESDSPKITVVNAVKMSDELSSEDPTTFAPLNQINENPTEKEEENEKITTTTTEDGRSASADELKDSFPNDTDPDEPLDETLPLPRRNGFYFLADWNSFLEVGQDEEKVVVRFDPKIGDPSRFIPVHIPSKTR
ncbi:mucin-2 [Culicoides brevitarsis]|uniref:mucin-2 n=1 Tax=Culicoides brevitarsis TaxID=469753 RepID=UPI00307B65A4